MEDERLYNTVNFAAVKRMFNTIFAKNFCKKCVFKLKNDVRLWSIWGKLTLMETYWSHEFIKENQIGLLKLGYRLYGRISTAYSIRVLRPRTGFLIRLPSGWKIIFWISKNFLDCIKPHSKNGKRVLLSILTENAYNKGCESGQGCYNMDRQILIVFLKFSRD